ncbi:MAG: hypothetical protein OEQ47_00515 [Acidimicrobiia bacterium]|nr:hypothetical protein [Acidimicrobiia bacterium]
MNTFTTSSPTTPASRRENLLTSLFATWLIAGVFVDGWAHNNLSEFETFWTPWHGLFYSGFAATAGWIVWIVRGRLLAGGSLADSIPVGYRSSIAGLGIFAAGGIGDAIWHSVLGVETDVDALFSPTHILLFTGVMLIVTGPIRSMSARFPSRRVPKGEFLPAGISVTLSLLMVVFFTMYSWAPTSGVYQARFIPNVIGWFEAVFGVLLILVTTITVSSAVLWLSSRWRVPFGTFTAMLTSIGILMSGMLDEFAEPWEVLPAATAGLAADLLIRAFDPQPARMTSWMCFGAAVPLVMWTAHFALFAVFRDLGWTAELWGGVPVLGAMTGALLAYLIGFAPPPADAVDGDPKEALATSYR